MSRGRHASRAVTARDILYMAVGMVTFAVIVFGGLWLWADARGTDIVSDTTAAPETTVGGTPSGSASVSTTVQDTTTIPATTSAPSTTAALPTTSLGSSLRTPSSLTVQVLNSVGTNGLAASATERLKALGYQTLEPADYSPLLDRSKILFRKGLGPEAFELGAQFPDAEIGQNPDEAPVADLVVLLGSSYDQG
jgi:hypothetical protein